MTAVKIYHSQPFALEFRYFVTLKRLLALNQSKMRIRHFHFATLSLHFAEKTTVTVFR